MAKVDCTPLAAELSKLVLRMAEHPDSPGFDEIAKQIAKDTGGEIDRRMIVEAMEAQRLANSPGNRVMTDLEKRLADARKNRGKVAGEAKSESAATAEIERLRNQLRGIDKAQNAPTPARGKKQVSNALASLRAERDALKKQIPKTAEETQKAYDERMKDRQSRLKDYEALIGQLQRRDFVPLEKPPARRLDRKEERILDQIALARREAQGYLNAQKPKQLYNVLVKEPTNVLGSVLVTVSGAHSTIHGGFMLLSHPIVTAADFFKVMPGSMTRLGEEGLHRRLTGRPDYEDARLAGVHFTKPGGRDEIGLSTLMEHVPVFAQSARIYRQFLNHARLDLFSLTRETVHGGELTREEARALAHSSNSLTGYGEAKTKWGQTAMNFSEDKLFAPRLTLASIQQALGEPIWSAPTARLKWAIMKQYGRAALTFGAISAVGALLGAPTDLDLASPTFGQLKWGKNHYDFGFRMGSYYHLLFELIAGETRDAQGGPMKSVNRGEVMGRFLRGKLGPRYSIGYALLTNKDYLGNTANVGTEIKSYLYPLGLKDVVEVFKENDMGMPETWMKAMLRFFVAGRYGGITTEDNPAAARRAAKMSREERARTNLHPEGLKEQIAARIGLGLDSGIQTEAQYQARKKMRNQFLPTVE